MRIRIQKTIFLISLFIMPAALTSCDKEDEDNKELKGFASIELTDAPSDDPSVKGTFITVSKVSIGGEPVQGFEKTTIDLMAYQNGETKLLTNATLDEKSYSEITLTLDFEQDAEGNSPGCYVLDSETNAKHKLTANSNEITAQSSFDVTSSTLIPLVIDFDLRKTVVRDENNEYTFASDAELESGIRLVNKNESGIIEGNCTESGTRSDKIVVYTYEKGNYNRSQEVNGQGSSEIKFANAVSSSEVDAEGNYEMHFLEEGNYELHFASFTENSEGQLELSGTVEVNILGSLDANNVQVDASSSTKIDVEVTGILPI